MKKIVITGFQADTKDYVKSMKKADESNKKFEKSSEDTTKAVDAMNEELSNTIASLGILPAGATKSLGGLRKLTTGFKTLRGAIIATGIGALVVALGSLVAFLTQTQKGQEKLNIAIGAAKGVFGNFLKIVTDLGEIIITAFTSPQEAVEMFQQKFDGLIRLVKSGGTVIWKTLTLQWGEVGDAWDDFTSSATESWKGWTDAANEGIKTAEKENALIRSRQAFIVREAALRNEISELILASRDINKDAAAREQDVVKAQELQKTLNAERLRMAKEELAIAQANADLAPNDIDANTQLQEKRAAILEVNKMNNDQLRELVNRQTEMNTKVEAERKEREAMFEDILAQNEVLQENDVAELETKDKILESLMKKNALIQKEGEEAKKQSEFRKADIEKQDAENKQVAINRATYAGMAADAIGGVSNELGVFQKEAALIQAVINTYEGATKALAQGGIFGAVTAAIVIAMGLAQVAKISGLAVPQYGEGGVVPGLTGGMIRGRSHALGGVKFGVGGRYEAEGGEYIVNRKSTSAFLPLLESINSYGRKFASGGVVPGGIGGTGKELAIVRSDFSSALKNMPQNVLVTEDLDEVQNRVAITENRATL